MTDPTPRPDAAPDVLAAMEAIRDREPCEAERDVQAGAVARVQQSHHYAAACIAIECIDVLTADLARLRAPADLAAIEARAAAAREATRDRRECPDCGLADPPATVENGSEFHTDCPMVQRYGGTCAVGTHYSLLMREQTNALADDIDALLAHIAAERERHAAAFDDLRSERDEARRAMDEVRAAYPEAFDCGAFVGRVPATEAP